MIHWQIQFKNINEELLTVSIYDNDYTGTPVQLIGAAEPFTTDEDDSDDPFTPIRTQSGYIRFICEDDMILVNMMPQTATSRPVELTNSAGSVLWQGFLTGEQYSQPWDQTPYEAAVPICSVMEAMMNVPFGQNSGFNSIYTVLQTIDTYCHSSHRKIAADVFGTNDICVRGYVRNDNWQTPTTASDRRNNGSTDFYDCRSLYEVVEEWMKFYGLTLHEYADAFVMTSPCATSYVQLLGVAGVTNNTELRTFNIQNLDIKSTNNMRDYSQAYGRLVGTFKTESSRDVLMTIGEFLDEFEPVRLTGVEDTINFRDNDWIKSYIYGGGIASDVDFLSSTSAGLSGGNMVRWGPGGFNLKDYFVVKSAMKGTANFTAINIDNPFKTYAHGYMDDMLRIEANVHRLINRGVQPADDIDKIYLRVKVGNKYLKWLSTGNYSWVNTPEVCSIDCEGGRIKDRTIVTILNDGLPTSTTMNMMMGSTSGFNIMLPIEYSPREVKVELIANGESPRVTQTYLISNLNISLIPCRNNQSWTYSEKENVYRYNLGGLFPAIYNRDCDITTRQASQNGSGILRASNGRYLYEGLKYEHNGISKMRTFYGIPHEVLTIDQSARNVPQSYITDGQKRYAILSQSTNWRDGVTRIKIIHYKTEEEE